MKDIHVDKNELLAILRENRANHRETFEKAQVVFRERLIEELDRKLEDARAGRRVDVHVRLPVPEDHTGDYDRVIRMLELEVDTTVMLSEQDMNQYVQDQWGWNASFAANTTSYLAQ